MGPGTCDLAFVKRPGPSRMRTSPGVETFPRTRAGRSLRGKVDKRGVPCFRFSVVNQLNDVSVCFVGASVPSPYPRQ
jgi:hypothetical protein